MPDKFSNRLPPDIEAMIDSAAFDHAAPKPRRFNGKAEGVTIDDLHAYMPQHCYIFEPTREMWPASSVNARIAPIKDGKSKPISASAWLDQHRPVEQMTWAPGMPTLIRDRLIAEGGWIERSGVTTFNLYRPPAIKLGDAAKATPWIEHAHRVFGDDAEHVIRWLSHRVQRPHQKINHALVLGGNQGIGKDTLLEPVKHAVGPWNFLEISPQHALSRFNGFLKSVILRISEARDLGDVDRFKFYDHLKSFTAAPPDVLRVDEKNLREHAIINVTGVIITSNHKSDGIYLPRTIAAISSPGRSSPRTISPPTIGTRFGPGTSAAATATSPHTSPSSTFRASTRRHHHRRPWHSGLSSMQAAHRKTPNSPTCSISSAIPMRSPLRVSPMLPAVGSKRGSVTAKTAA
jgi:hypothetical protein